MCIGEGLAMVAPHNQSVPRLSYAIPAAMAGERKSKLAFHRLLKPGVFRTCASGDDAARERLEVFAWHHGRAVGDQAHGKGIKGCRKLH